MRAAPSPSRARRFSLHPPRARGFTLIEMIITTSIVAVMAVILTGLISTMFSSYTAQYQMTEQNAEAKLALERMLRELREIRSAIALDLTMLPSTQITFNDPTGAAINYALVGANIQRNGSNLADGASALQFTYYDSAGAVTAAVGLVCYIRVSFTLTQNGIATAIRGDVKPRVFRCR